MVQNPNSRLRDSCRWAGFISCVHCSHWKIGYFSHDYRAIIVSYEIRDILRSTELYRRLLPPVHFTNPRCLPSNNIRDTLYTCENRSVSTLVCACNSYAHVIALDSNDIMYARVTILSTSARGKNSLGRRETGGWVDEREDTEGFVVGGLSEWGVGGSGGVNQVNGSTLWGTRPGYGGIGPIGAI